MAHEHTSERKTHGTIGRVIALVMVVGVPVTVSIVSEPEQSTAILPVPHEAARWLDETAQWPLVGELVSSKYLVRVYAAEGGMMYTVCRPDGAVIQAGLSGDQVAELFPDLDLRAAGDEGYLLMQVETDG